MSIEIYSVPGVASPVTGGGSGTAGQPAVWTNTTTIRAAGYATTATAAGTTTLTNTSALDQFFTGVSTQTVVLPNATTLALGWRFRIHNNSTGAVTIQDASAAVVWIVAPSSDVLLTCTSVGAAAGVWDVHYVAMGIASGKKTAFANSLSFSGTDGTLMTFPSTNATLARTDAAQSFTGTQTFNNGYKVIADANGSFWTESGASELLTLNTGSTLSATSGNLALSNSICDIILVRITTTITTAANFQVSLAGGAAWKMISTATTSLTTLTAGTTYILRPPAYDGGDVSTAKQIAVTTNVNPGAGAMRITTCCRVFSPPTS